MRLFLVLAAAVAVAPLDAQTSGVQAADTILSRVAALYSGARQYHFAALKTGEEKGSLEIWVRHPDRFRFEGDGGVIDGSDPFPKVTFTGNGDDAWNYVPILKQYTKKRTTLPLLDTEPPEIAPDAFVFQADAVFLTRYARLAKAPEHARLAREETISMGSRPVACYVIELHAPLAGFRDDYTWWVDKKRFLILREDTKPATARRPSSRIEFTAASIDEPVSDDLFHFVPPEGTKLVDRFGP